MAKLLIAVVHGDDAPRVVEALRAADMRLTEVPARGGFLRGRNVMIYMGLDDEQVPEALQLIEENCRSRTMSVPLEPLGGLEASWLPTEVTQGGATIFLVPMEEIRRV